MQMYLADCQFPDIDNQVKAYKLFVEAWAVSYTHLTLPTNREV